MGLDMYWYVGPTKEEKAQALIEGRDTGDTELRQEIGYFREFHDLNDFMGELYPEDLQVDFNCMDLEIGWNELAAMRRFHTGPYVPTDLQRELNQICDRIETGLKEGRKVWYWPWW